MISTTYGCYPTPVVKVGLGIAIHAEVGCYDSVRSSVSRALGAVLIGMDSRVPRILEGLIS